MFLVFGREIFLEESVSLTCRVFVCVSVCVGCDEEDGHDSGGEFSETVVVVVDG